MDKTKLLRELSAAEFAAWELHLYLDTHKCDEKAMDMYEKYARRAAELKLEYEESCGPISSDFAAGAEWIKNPWPWDYKECDC